MVTFLNQSVTTWLKQTFTEADKNGDGSLSISEVLQLLHKLNVNLPRQKVKQMFKVQSKLNLSDLQTQEDRMGHKGMCGHMV